MIRLHLFFMQEEENWLSCRLELFSRTFKEVSLGYDNIEEFIMFSYGVPLSKSYMKRSVSAFKERFRRLLCGHEDFNTGLSAAMQREVRAKTKVQERISAYNKYVQDQASRTRSGKNSLPCLPKCALKVNV